MAKRARLVSRDDGSVEVSGKYMISVRMAHKIKDYSEMAKPMV